ncbi:MAG: hypothetical protein ACK4SO_05170, partial [Candidatus Kapaibacteriota bacterium]
DTFDEEQIGDYYDLAQNLMKDSSDTSIPPFERFQSKIDSIKALLDTLMKRPSFPPLPNENKILNFSSKIDSILNSTLAELNVNFNDSLIKFQNKFVDSVLKKLFYDIDINDSLIKFQNKFLDSMIKKYFYSTPPKESFNEFDKNNFKRESGEDHSTIDLNNLLKNWSQYIKIYNESIKVLFEYLETYFKLLQEYGKLLSSYIEESIKTPDKNKNALEKKFQKKMKELEKKNKELEKRSEMKLKQLEKKKQSLLNENSIKLPNKTQQEKLKRLIEQHNKFVNSLITLKKRIELEIIQDLQKKNYIQSEVPQNLEMK